MRFSVIATTCLAEAGLTVTPLLLVQVDSEAGSVEQATQWLKEMGFRSDGDSGLIRAHTADEPDPYLSTIAADETVEALIFKLSVATGFDAPRAFTLVSFRRSRNEDFGVQIVGRILRVDRRLQVAKDLPAMLNNGYVFLSDNEGQIGLSSAAQRINAVKTELASISTNVAVVSLDRDEPVAQVTKNGQTSFLTAGGGIISAEDPIDELPRTPEPGTLNESGPAGISAHEEQNTLFGSWGLTSPTKSGPSPKPPQVTGRSSYVGAPHQQQCRRARCAGQPDGNRSACRTATSGQTASRFPAPDSSSPISRPESRCGC